MFCILYKLARSSRDTQPLAFFYFEMLPVPLYRDCCARASVRAHWGFPRVTKTASRFTCQLFACSCVLRQELVL